MGTIQEQHEIVKNSLIKFIEGHIPGADFTVIDDIVLSYIVSILEEASSDSGLDIEGFIEMLSAYFENFSQINQDTVCNWIFSLGGMLSDKHKQTETNATAESLASMSLCDLIPQEKLIAQKHERVKTVSETSDAGSDTSNCDFFSEECEILQEMFPDTSFLEVKHCISIAKGDLDSATQILLHRQEAGQALANHHTGIQNPKNVVIDDTELKNRIIARYSYVDKNAESKEYKPLVPKVEPKKMVRYRDNKIVSLRGEKFTEVSGDSESDLPKKQKRQINS